VPLGQVEVAPRISTFWAASGASKRRVQMVVLRIALLVSNESLVTIAGVPHGGASERCHKTVRLPPVRCALTAQSACCTDKRTWHGGFKPNAPTGPTTFA